MRWLAAALIAALAAAAAVMPAPETPLPGSHPEAASPAVATCPVEEGSGRSTELSVLSSLSGPVSTTVFGGGQTPESLQTAIGPSGSLSLPGAELQAVGSVGALVETSTIDSAAAFSVTGSETLSGEPCFHGNPSGQVFISGGATTEGNQFELHLMNPYSGEAVVDLVVQSESGRESNDRFDSLVVPAVGVVVLDMTRLIPGRSTVSVTVEPLSGSAWVVGNQRRVGDNASWRAIPAGADWYLPIPSGPGARIHLATPVNAEVGYQIDLYGPEGLVLTWQSGTLPPRGQAVVDLAELGGAAAAVKIAATGPLVPTLWMDSEAGLAITTASPVQAESWLLPGAGGPAGGSAALVMVNTGVDATVAAVRTVKEGPLEQQVPLGVDAVVEVPLASADAHRVDADGAVVVMWVARRGSAALAAMGVPLGDG